MGESWGGPDSTSRCQRSTLRPLRSPGLRLGSSLGVPPTPPRLTLKGNRRSTPAPQAKSQEPTAPETGAVGAQVSGGLAVSSTEGDSRVNSSPQSWHKRPTCTLQTGHCLLLNLTQGLSSCWGGGGRVPHCRGGAERGPSRQGGGGGGQWGPSLTRGGVGDLAVVVHVALHRAGGGRGPGEGVFAVLHRADEHGPGVLETSKDKDGCQQAAGRTWEQR